VCAEMHSLYSSVMLSELKSLLTVACVLSLTAIGVASAECNVSGGDWRAGSKIYHQTCITCHGENGQGTVAGAPDFRAGVLGYPAPTLMEHIKNGFRSRSAPKAMPPKGNNPDLSDQDIKDVLNYLYHQFGCG
jgi:mono/diheme cytochrome c family protein